MLRRATGFIAIVAALALAALLPWLFSDRVDLAQGVLLLGACALLAGITMTAAVAYALMAPATAPNRVRPAVPVAYLSGGVALVVTGLTLAVSLYYVDYFLLQRVIVETAGTTAIGLGSTFVLLAARMRKRTPG